jgi:hypothetical protein
MPKRLPIATDACLHDNYGPVIWGGTGERWDLLQLHRDGPLDGGDRLREQIRHHLTMISGQVPSDRLQFRGVAGDQGPWHNPQGAA